MANQLPNPQNIVLTQGVLALKGIGFETALSDYLFERALTTAVFEAYEKQSDTCTDGGNDKYFFTLVFRGTKLFAAANEVNGLTIMLPSEY